MRARTAACGPVCGRWLGARRRRPEPARPRETAAFLFAAVLAGGAIPAAAGGTLPEYGRTSTFGGSGSLGAQVCRIAADTNRNTYVTGDLHDPTDLDPGPGEAIHNGRSDAFVACWDREAGYRWSVSFGDPAYTHARLAEGHAIAVSDRGKVFVGGRITGDVDMDPGPGVAILRGTQGGAYLLCLDATNGACVWARVIDDWYLDETFGVGTDTNGGVYFAGVFGSETIDVDPTSGVDVRTNLCTGGRSSAFVTRLRDDGNYGWTRTFGGANTVTECFDLAVTPAGGVYAVGRFWGTTDFDDGAGREVRTSQWEDAFLAALDADGALRWVRAWGSSGRDNAAEVAVSDAGVAVVGSFSGIVDFDPGPAVVSRDSADGSHYAAFYSHQGDLRWVYTFPAESEPKHIRFSPGVGMDRLGNVFFTSRYGNSGGNVDFLYGPGADMHTGPGAFLSRIDADGGYAWTVCMTQALDKITTSGFDVAIDAGGDAIVVGTFEGIVDFDPGQGLDLLAATNDFKSYVCRLRGADRTQRGTPAWWLADFGLRDDGADDDGDGMFTWSEYLADTDPTDDSSALRLGAMTCVDGKPAFRWWGGRKATQVLECRERMSDDDAWRPILTKVPPTPLETLFVEDTPAVTSRFYRVITRR